MGAPCRGAQLALACAGVPHLRRQANLQRHGLATPRTIRPAACVCRLAPAPAGYSGAARGRGGLRLGGCPDPKSSRANRIRSDLRRTRVGGASGRPGSALPRVSACRGECMIRYRYTGHLQPPAPFVHVTVACPATATVVTVWSVPVVSGGSILPLSPQPASNQVSQATDRRGEDGAPGHVRHRQDPRPVLDGRLVREVVGRIGDQAKESA